MQDNSREWWRKELENLENLENVHTYSIFLSNNKLVSTRHLQYILPLIKDYINGGNVYLNGLKVDFPNFDNTYSNHNTNIVYPNDYGAETDRELSKDPELAKDVHKKQNLLCVVTTICDMIDNFNLNKPEDIEEIIEHLEQYKLDKS